MVLLKGANFSIFRMHFFGKVTLSVQVMFMLMILCSFDQGVHRIKRGVKFDIPYGNY